MKTRVVITTEGLGSDNTLFFDYDIDTWQGLAKVRQWATYLSKRQGMPVNVYTHYAWYEDKRPFMRLNAA